MAKKTIARNQGQNQAQPVDREIRRAADRIGHVPDEGDRWQRARRLQELHLLIWRLRWEAGPRKVLPVVEGGAS